MRRPGQEIRRHRVAVLGAGVMGRLHVRVFSELSARFEVVGVFDTSAAVAESVAAERGIACFADEALAVAAADLVVVASPISAHASSVRLALEAGKNVLVEKPLCARASEAALLASIAGPGRQLFVGHSERFNPVVVAIRELVRPHLIRTIDLCRVATPPQRGRGVDDHGVLVSLAVHDLDLAAYLTGGSIDLRDASGSAGYPGERARLVLACGSGATAHLWADRTSRSRARTLELRTALNVFAGDLLSPRLVRTCRATGIASEIPLTNVEPLVAQARAIASVLDGGMASEVATGVDGARAIAVAERAGAWLRREEMRGVEEAS